MLILRVNQWKMHFAEIAGCGYFHFFPAGMTSQQLPKCRILWHELENSRTYDSLRAHRTGRADDGFLSFFQLNDSVCLVTNSIADKISWSNAVPGVVRHSALDSTGSSVALAFETKLLVTDNLPSFNLNYIGLPVTSANSIFKPSGVCFNPLNSSQLLVSGGRDIRVIDVTRSSIDVAKTVMTISGAAAQAVPRSFSFLVDSPNVLATGWELPSSSYVRLVDLREGSSKSVRIWKTKNVNGLCTSKDQYLAGSWDNSVSIWNLRSGAQDDSLSFQTKDPVSELHWSVSKNSTLGVLCGDGELFVRRLDLGKNEPVVTKAAVGAFAFTWSNDLAVMDKNSGAVSIAETKRFPIPLIHPRTGGLVSVSRTGYAWSDSQGNADLLKTVSDLATRMDSNSLVEAVSSSNDFKDIDFAVRDDVNWNSDLIADREKFIQLLLPRENSDLVIAILKNDLNAALRLVVHSDNPDPHLLRALTTAAVSESKPKVEISPGWSGEVKSAFKVFNTETTDIDVFVRACVAVLQTEDAEELRTTLKPLAAEAEKTTTSLRTLVLTGFGNSEKVKKIVNKSVQTNLGILHVALVGLLIRSPEPVFRKAIDFIRNEICNRLRGECWRLRSVIDSMLNEDSSSGGTGRLMCYYCNKIYACGTTTGETTRCPHRGCHKPLPSCCVCLEPLKLGTQSIDDWSVWCSSCRHGGHRSHIGRWFENFDECPVAGCNCQCASIDGI